MERFTILYIRFSGKSRPSHKKIETLMDGSTFFVVSCLREPAVDYSIAMNRTKNKLLAVGLSIAALLSACQKDSLTGRLELTAERMGGNGTKMYVDGLAAYWLSGDRVNINGENYSLTVNSSQAYVENEFSATNYCIVFPSSIFVSRTDNILTVDMPESYQYRTETVPGVGKRQILDAPLAYYGAASEGKAHLLHLTGALSIQLTGWIGWLDSVIVTSAASQISGHMDIDLSDIEHGCTSMSTDVASNRSVAMTFGSDGLLLGGNNITIQIPIYAVSNDIFTIRIVGHSETRKFVFERTQTSSGTLVRGELGKVLVNYDSDQDYITQYERLETLNDGSFAINNLDEFKLMKTFISTYNLKALDGTYYRQKDYTFEADIDASGYTINPILNYTGVLNGNGHSISNLTIEALNNGGQISLFGEVQNYSNVSRSVNGLTLRKLKLKSTRTGSITAGAFYSSEGGSRSNSITISNCHVDTMYLVCPNATQLIIGGLVGEFSSDHPLGITGSSFTGRIDISGNTSTSSVYFGGLVGNYQYYASSGSIIENCSVNMYAQISCWYGSSTAVYAGGLVGNVGVDPTIEVYGNSIAGILNASSRENGAVGDYVGNIMTSAHWITDNSRPNSSSLVKY